jgi:hypothetical protein
MLSNVFYKEHTKSYIYSRAHIGNCYNIFVRYWLLSYFEWLIMALNKYILNIVQHLEIALVIRKKYYNKSI